MKKTTTKQVIGKSSVLLALTFLFSLTACESGTNTFDDFDYTSVYFPNSGYIRTIELGEDTEVDLTNDNAHTISINAGMGGVYDNTRTITMSYVVDASLLKGQTFDDGTAITLMPESYYTLNSDKLVIPSGKIQGGVTVQLHDAFFADAQAINNHYAIPLRITQVEGADTILESKDYVIAAVKYVNPWHAVYLRHGVDDITYADGTKTQNVRHTEYVENNDLISLTTKSMNQVVLTVALKDATGKEYPCELLLTFDDNNACTVSTSTEGFTVNGTGLFVLKGEKQSMGGKDRNALYLNYTLNSTALGQSVNTIDTLVVRNRGIAPEYFTPTVK